MGDRFAVEAYADYFHKEQVVLDSHLVVLQALEGNQVVCLLVVVEILVDHQVVVENREVLMVGVEIHQVRLVVAENRVDYSSEAGNQIDLIVVVGNQAEC